MPPPHKFRIFFISNNVMTYFSLHLIANKTVELVYKNAPEFYFEIKKSSLQGTRLEIPGLPISENVLWEGRALS